MQEKREFLKGLAVGVIAAMVIAGAVWTLGRMTGVAGWRPETGKETEAALDLTSPEVYQKLTEVEALMEKYYLEEIDPGQVEDYLYKGTVAGLGDIYAAYYNEEEYRSMLESTNGSYCGIGVQVSQNMTTGIMTIVAVFPDSPAMEVGLKPGDILYKVGGKDVTGEDLNKVVSMIKGEEFTTTTVSVAREGEEEYLEFEVERRTVEVPTVSYEMLEGGVGYIAISTFDEVTTEQFNRALEDLESQGLKSLVVDLRNNGGGLVRSVCDILDRLLPEGLLVYTEDKNGVREEEHSDGETYFAKPMAVLVNGNSASASEIFAGAIKDYEAGVLVGTTTYGKGIVQKIYPLSDGTAVKLTVSKYYTPNGNNIHGVGIEPDVEVELDESLKNLSVIPREEDNQLQKALEVLNSQCEIE